MHFLFSVTVTLLKTLICLILQFILCSVHVFVWMFTDIPEWWGMERNDWMFSASLLEYARTLVCECRVLDSCELAVKLYLQHPSCVFFSVLLRSVVYWCIRLIKNLFIASFSCGILFTSHAAWILFIYIYITWYGVGIIVTHLVFILIGYFVSLIEHTGGA